jgi:ubiquinone/menaquinone biosynthesis C-methylase UbiE
MDLANPAQRRVFFDVHSGLPREGPGNRASTARALRLMGELPPAPLILDVACGPGTQTLDLAELVPNARFVAIDGHPPFIDELRRRARLAGVEDRIDARAGDMRALPFAPGSVDVIWCEGAAYIMGVPAALAAWAPLLKPGGRIALTEAVWLKSDPPEPVRANWTEYPDMTNGDGCRAIIRRTGLKLLGDFVLPESAWWDDYYGPLETRTRQLSEKYHDDAIAQLVLDEAISEVAVYRQYSAYYGYQFFVMSR